MYLYPWISLDIMDIVVILAYKFDYMTASGIGMWYAKVVYELH